MKRSTNIHSATLAASHTYRTIESLVTAVNNWLRAKNARAVAELRKAI